MSAEYLDYTPPPLLNTAAIGWAGAFVFACIVVIFLGFVAVDSRRRLSDAERRADREKEHADRAWDLIFRLRSVEKPPPSRSAANSHVVPLAAKGGPTR